jgi:hypothetical protein
MSRKIHPNALKAAIEEKFSIPVSEVTAANLNGQLLPTVVCIDNNKTFFRKINPANLQDDFELIYLLGLDRFLKSPATQYKNPKRFLEQEIAWTNDTLVSFKPRQENYSLLKSYSDFLNEEETTNLYKAIVINHFESVFEKAVEFELIEVKSEAHKSVESSFHNFQFNEWLKVNFNIQELTKFNYSKYCTFENFKVYLVQCDPGNAQLILLNPTHNFELLKIHRQGLFKKKKAEFISERKEKNVSTNKIDTDLFYQLWLQKELKVIDHWHGDKFPSGEKKSIMLRDTVKVEIIKYQNYIQVELRNIELQNKNNSTSQTIDTTPISKNKLDTSVLENCVRIMSHHLDGDESLISELEAIGYDYYKMFVNPFKIELNNNLLVKETFEGKRDLLKHYIFEFKEMPFFFDANHELIFEGSLSHNNPKYGSISFTNKSGETRELIGHEKYVIQCEEIFDALFHEIQLCCIKYKFDIYELCDELKFPTNIFDSGISMAYEKQTQQESNNIDKRVSIPDNVNTFFKKVNTGEITQIEIYNHVQKITDNFNFDKLNLLEDDFDFYFFMEREKKMAEFTPEDIFQKMEEFEKNNRPIPKIKFPPLKTKNGDKIVEDAIDYEKLLYPYDFFHCYRFHNFLKEEIKQRVPVEDPKPIQNKESISANAIYFEYVDLQKNSSKLNDLLDQLKKHQFVQVDTKLINFKKIFSGKPVEGIVWIGNMTELQYLFKLLYKDKLKKIQGSHWKVVCQYFIDEKGDRYDYKKFKDLKKPIQKRASLLEKMVSRL